MPATLGLIGSPRVCRGHVPAILIAAARNSAGRRAAADWFPGEPPEDAAAGPRGTGRVALVLE